MANSVDPDQLASSLDQYCLQKQGISGFSMTRVKEGPMGKQKVVA